MPGASDCLIIIDVQNDFCPGGALAVEDGDAVVPIINHLQSQFSHRLLTQDWHPSDHLSFASSHDGKQPFDTTTLSYGEQVLWPDHCVQGTAGSKFHDQLATAGVELIIRKGFRRSIDSYSGFFENDHKTPTGLAGYLRERQFDHLYVCGLATDFCVAFTAIDACNLGFSVTLLEDACRAIDLDGSLATARQQMIDAGVSITTTADLS